MTGLNFSVMQASLALYDHDKVKRIFYSANLLTGTYAHPFLGSVMKNEYRDVYEFYLAYMQGKISYLGNRIKKANYGYCGFLRKDSSKWAKRDDEYYKALAQRYRDQPVELPRGLFVCSIAQKLKSLNNEDINAALSQEHCNVNYMIKTYFNFVRKDAAQPFYSSPLVGLRPLCDKMNDKETTDEERTHIKNKIRDKEKLIRQYSIQDMLVLMMAENIIMDKSIKKTKPTEMKLCSISSGDSNLLDMLISFSIKVKSPDGKFTEVEQKEMKIKDYGKFLNLLHDRRVKTLLGKIPEEKIARADLEEELDNFDRVTPNVHREIDEFEDNETQGMSENEINAKYKKASPQFSTIMSKSTSYDEQYKKLLIELRNVFSHRYYPEAHASLANLYKLKTLPEIAKYMDEIFSRTIK